MKSIKSTMRKQSSNLPNTDSIYVALVTTLQTPPQKPILCHESSEMSLAAREHQQSGHSTEEISLQAMSVECDPGRGGSDHTYPALNAGSLQLWQKLGPQLKKTNCTDASGRSLNHKWWEISQALPALSSFLTANGGSVHALNW